MQVLRNISARAHFCLTLEFERRKLDKPQYTLHHLHYQYTGYHCL